MNQTVVVNVSDALQQHFHVRFHLVFGQRGRGTFQDFAQIGTQQCHDEHDGTAMGYDVVQTYNVGVVATYFLQRSNFAQRLVGERIAGGHVAQPYSFGGFVRAVTVVPYSVDLAKGTFSNALEQCVVVHGVVAAVFVYK